MSKNAHPKELRLGYLDKWSSRWFKDGSMKDTLREDGVIRDTIRNNYENAGIEEIVIKRSPEAIEISIHTARPGLIIGRGGEEINSLKRKLENRLSGDQKINIEIQEIRKPERQASIIAQNIVEQLERRVPHRSAMKRALDKVPVKEDGDIQGAKIQVAGRLNGAAIARTEHIEQGKIPLQTIRGKIDYSFQEANTKWGSIGVKVWLYKGEVFEEEEQE